MFPTVCSKRSARASSRPRDEPNPCVSSSRFPSWSLQPMRSACFPPRSCAAASSCTWECQRIRRNWSNFWSSAAKVHFPQAGNDHEALFSTAAKLIANERAEARERFVKPLPGQAEFLDLLRAVLVLGEIGRNSHGTSRVDQALRFEEAGKPRRMSGIGFTRGMTGRADLIRARRLRDPELEHYLAGLLGYRLLAPELPKIDPAANKARGNRAAGSTAPTSASVTHGIPFWQATHFEVLQPTVGRNGGDRGRRGT